MRSRAVFAVFVICASLLAPGAWTQSVPERLPTTPEGALLQIQQRLTQLEAQVSALQSQSRHQAAQLRQQQRTIAARGETIVQLDAAAREPTTSEDSPNREPGASNVVAPFTVTDRRGRILLEVTSDPRPRIRLFGVQGRAAELGVDERGWSSFVLNDSRGSPYAMLGRDLTMGSLTLFRSETSKRLVRLDERGLAYYNAADKSVARLGGIDANGGGEVLVGSSKGAVGVSLMAADDGAALVMQKPNGAPIALLNKSGLLLSNPTGGAAALLGSEKSGAGVMQLYNAAGVASLEAGADPDGVGWVHAGPKYRCMAMSGPTVMAGGIPDCLRGKLK